METSKAIKLIENYVTHYLLVANLYDIGLPPENWLLDKTGLCTIIFDIDEERGDIDDVLSLFWKHSNRLRDSIKNHNDCIPRDALTNTAIDIYSDWKAYSMREIIKT